MSQPARAVWIEIDCPIIDTLIMPSQPARAVWIEISPPTMMIPSLLSQPARAVWIEILMLLQNDFKTMGHSLRGLCGLKFYDFINARISIWSQPARAVWIEIVSQEY